MSITTSVNIELKAITDIPGKTSAINTGQTDIFIPKSTGHRKVSDPSEVIVKLACASTPGAEVKWEGAIRGAGHAACAGNGIFQLIIKS